MANTDAHVAIAFSDQVVVYALVNGEQIATYAVANVETLQFLDDKIAFVSNGTLFVHILLDPHRNWCYTCSCAIVSLSEKYVFFLETALILSGSPLFPNYDYSKYFNSKQVDSILSLVAISDHQIYACNSDSMLRQWSIDSKECTKSMQLLSPATQLSYSNNKYSMF